MRERRSERFMLALSPTERRELDRLAERERLSAAAVVRRLIWREAKALRNSRQQQERAA